MDLTDKQWAVLEPIFRPRRRPRAVLNGALWVLRPARRGTTCRPGIRRIKRAIGAFSSGNDPADSTSCCNGWPKILRDRGRIDLFEAFVDATFAPGKKGGLPLALPAVVKGASVFLSPCMCQRCTA